MLFYQRGKFMTKKDYDCELFGCGDSFWTRDDLDEFLSELEDTPEIKQKKITIKGIFMERDNELQVDVESADGCSWTVIQKIDMRKIKTPHDLITKYLKPVVETILGDVDY